ncbi:MAG: CaiB/BaiF CoA-transferase family protein [Pseudomonadota bacterium]
MTENQTNPTAATPTGALAGLRVLELGTLIAGPFCGQLMGDMGAEVIKVEAPGVGDPMRDWGRGIKVWWPLIARNKKSVTLNLRVAEGQRLLKDLVSQSDILIENFRPGTMEKWGLGWQELSAINPGLIMVRVSGFGQTGPYAGRAGYGSVGEAMGGLRYVTGDPDRVPARAGISIGDSLAATFACVGALAALNHRHHTGQGQVVDSAIYEAVLAVMESTVPEFTEGGFVRERSGSILPKTAPSNVYPTSDGELVVMGANQNNPFARLTRLMGQPGLAEDARFADHIARGENQDELDELISAWTATVPAAELLAQLEREGVPAGRIYRAPDMLEDEQFRARDAIIEVSNQTFGKLKMQNVFPKLSATPGSVRWTGAALGEHTDAVLGELCGIEPARLLELRADGVV